MALLRAPACSAYVAFSPAGRVRLLATTAPTRGVRAVRPGSRMARLRRAYPRARRLSRELVAAGPRSRLFFGMRGSRVRFVALADHVLRRDPRPVGRYVRLAGLYRRVADRLLLPALAGGSVRTPGAPGP